LQESRQPLSPFKQNRLIGARASNQADRKPDFGKRSLRVHRTERVGRGKDYFEIGASCSPRPTNPIPM
jgi:hypothetical protein